MARQGQRAIGDEIASRLVALRGIRYFAKMAGLDKSLVTSMIEEDEEDVDDLPYRVTFFSNQIP